MELRKKSIHELRAIAQSFGVTDIFDKKADILAQEIELKQQSLIPAKVPLPDKPRFLDYSQEESARPDLIVDMLQEHIKRGLRVELHDLGWKMSCGVKTDEGTLKMPLKDILRCAQKLMT